jgi:hypothetical protein
MVHISGENCDSGDMKFRCLLSFLRLEHRASSANKKNTNQNEFANKGVANNKNCRKEAKTLPSQWMYAHAKHLTWA